MNFLLELLEHFRQNNIRMNQDADAEMSSDSGDDVENNCEFQNESINSIKFEDQMKINISFEVR